MPFLAGFRAVEARPRPEEHRPLKLILKGHGARAEVQFCTNGSDHLMGSDLFHTLRRDGRYPDVRCPGDDCPLYRKGDRPRPKFGVWCYVRSILHPRNDEGRVTWEPVRVPGGRTFYRETVNDFRVFFMGYGRDGRLWEQLKGYWREAGALDDCQYVIERRDLAHGGTAYIVHRRPFPAQWPEDLMERRGNLEPMDRVFERIALPLGRATEAPDGERQPGTRAA